MAELGPVAWPPLSTSTKRPVLRASAAEDRATTIELFASADVGAYVGGARPQEELEHEVPEIPGRRPGYFVVDLHGSMIGMVAFDRRDVERPGHVRAGGEEVEISYMLLPRMWGRGYAAEACAAALAWCDGAFAGEPVLLCTQAANQRSMKRAEKLGFKMADRFQEFGAEQWLGVRTPVFPAN